MSLVSVSIVVLRATRIHRRFQEIQADFSAITARVQENLAGVRVVRAFGREARELEACRPAKRRYLEKNLRLVRVSGLFDPSLTFFHRARLPAGALPRRPRGDPGAHHDRPVRAFTAYLGTLNWPMVALGWVVNLFQRGMASFARLAEILDAPVEITSPRRAAARGVPGRDRVPLPQLHVSGPPRGPRSSACRSTSGGCHGRGGRPHTARARVTLLALLGRTFDPPPGTVLLRRRGRAAARSSRGFARRSHRSRRTSSCSPTRWRRTIGLTAWPARNVRRWSAPPRSPASPTRSADSVRFDTVIGERGIHALGGQKQRVRSRARSARARRCCCSTTACRASGHPHRGGILTGPAPRDAPGAPALIRGARGEHSVRDQRTASWCSTTGA